MLVLAAKCAMTFRLAVLLVEGESPLWLCPAPAGMCMVVQPGRLQPLAGLAAFVTSHQGAAFKGRSLASLLPCWMPALEHGVPCALGCDQLSRCFLLNSCQHQQEPWEGSWSISGRRDSCCDRLSAGEGMPLAGDALLGGSGGLAAPPSPP